MHHRNVAARRTAGQRHVFRIGGIIRVKPVTQFSELVTEPSHAKRPAFPLDARSRRSIQINDPLIILLSSINDIEASVSVDIDCLSPDVVDVMVSSYSNPGLVFLSCGRVILNSVVLETTRITTVS